MYIEYLYTSAGGKKFPEGKKGMYNVRDRDKNANQAPLPFDQNPFGVGIKSPRMFHVEKTGPNSASRVLSPRDVYERQIRDSGKYYYAAGKNFQPPEESTRSHEELRKKAAELERKLDERIDYLKESEQKKLTLQKELDQHIKNHEKEIIGSGKKIIRDRVTTHYTEHGEREMAYLRAHASRVMSDRMDLSHEEYDRLIDYSHERFEGSIMDRHNNRNEKILGKMKQRERLMYVLGKEPRTPEKASYLRETASSATRNNSSASKNKSISEKRSKTRHDGVFIQPCQRHNKKFIEERKRSERVKHSGERNELTKHEQFIGYPGAQSSSSRYRTMKELMKGAVDRDDSMDIDEVRERLTEFKKEHLGSESIKKIEIQQKKFNPTPASVKSTTTGGATGSMGQKVIKPGFRSSEAIQDVDDPSKHAYRREKEHVDEFDEKNFVNADDIYKDSKESKVSKNRQFVKSHAEGRHNSADSYENLEFVQPSPSPERLYNKSNYTLENNKHSNNYRNYKNNINGVLFDSKNDIANKNSNNSSKESVKYESIKSPAYLRRNSRPTQSLQTRVRNGNVESTKNLNMNFTNTLGLTSVPTIGTGEMLDNILHNSTINSNNETNMIQIMNNNADSQLVVDSIAHSIRTGSSSIKTNSSRHSSKRISNSLNSSKRSSSTPNLTRC